MSERDLSHLGGTSPTPERNHRMRSSYTVPVPPTGPNPGGGMSIKDRFVRLALPVVLVATVLVLFVIHECGDGAEPSNASPASPESVEAGATPDPAAPAEVPVSPQMPV